MGGDQRKRTGVPAARLTVVAAVVAGAFAVMAPARASWASYEAVAVADGVRVLVNVPGAPVQDTAADAGSPTAQARLDGFGSSTAYAAAPFPGDVVLNVPGIASGAIDQDVPAYPLIAASSHPTQPETSAGGGALSARSAATTSAANATSGPATSTAEVSRNGDALHASATALVEGFSVGPLSLARVTATATAQRAPDGTVARSSKLEVTGMPDDLAGLQQQGITVRYLDEAERPDGVVSPGLEVTAAVPIGLGVSGTSTITWTLGRATALVPATAAPALAVAAPVDGPLAVVPGEPAAAGQVASVLGGSTLVAIPPTGLRSVIPARPTAGLHPVPAEVWPHDFYVLLIIAGVAAIAVTQALRVWGVRRVWAS